MSLVVHPNDIIAHRGGLAVKSVALDDICTKHANELLRTSGSEMIRYQENQRQRDRSDDSVSLPSFRYHLTLATAREWKSISKAGQDNFMSKLIQQKTLLLIRGVGENDDSTGGRCLYSVVSFPLAQALRGEAGLPFKDFHVTLGFLQHVPKRHVTKYGPELLPLQDLKHHKWLESLQENFRRIRRSEKDNQASEINDLRAALSASIATPPTRPGNAKDSTHSMSNIEWLIDVNLMRCRVEGYAECHEAVVDAATVILRLNPQHGPSLAFKGFSLYRMHHYNKAILYLDQAWAQYCIKPFKLSKKQARVLEDSLVACCQALHRQLPEPPLVKFPRTPHLFCLPHSSTVTEDDYVLSKDSELLLKLSSTDALIQEKVDGANLGLSLSYDGIQILVQNRSHYLHSGEHPQYGPLNSWIECHREDLMQILGGVARNSRQGLILYGEWMVARHSIPYHKLPGYFIAFDLFDVNENKFVSQRRLHSILQPTSIPVVPVIGHYRFSAKGIELEAELTTFLTEQSVFRNDSGHLEGIVLRLDSPMWLEHRGKLVRPDFVAGCQNGHWSRRQMESKPSTPNSENPI